DKLQLLGASLSSLRVSPREQLTLTVGVRALAPMTTDYHLTLQLLGPDGVQRHAQEHDLEGGVRGTSTWEPGRWLFRTFAVQPELKSPPGEYRLVLSVVDPKSGRALKPMLPPEGSFRLQGQDALIVDSIRVQ